MFSTIRPPLAPIIPYTLNEINSFLDAIQRNDFNFKVTDPHLNGIPNFVIAEYFVNLKFFIHKQINIASITNVIHTSMDICLYPVFTAPGGVSDMNFNDTISGNNISVETTIHNTIMSICNHECRPCIIHLESESGTNTNVTLILIEPLNSDPNIVNWFTIVGNAYFNSIGKIFRLQCLNFSDVARL